VVPLRERHPEHIATPLRPNNLPTIIVVYWFFLVRVDNPALEPQMGPGAPHTIGWNIKRVGEREKKGLARKTKSCNTK
jgi:hypothetical protein